MIPERDRAIAINPVYGRDEVHEHEDERQEHDDLAELRQPRQPIERSCSGA